MNKFIKLLQIKKKSSGFTLVELMVAMLITSLVISATGFGLVSITNKDKREKAETERRVELNRALDFIADEVRQAKPIATDASADLSTIAPGFDSTDKTPVLTLQIPDVKQRVIYYIASPPSNSVWLGPKVIYRWGPNFGNNGQYTNADNAPITGNNNPRNWQGEPLADLIVNTTPSSNPNCDSGWTANPAVASRTGFYACVDPSGKIADIHLRGKLTDAYGNSRDPLEVSSKVFARPYNPPFTLSVGSSSSAGNGGTITVTQQSTMYIEVLGGEINCDAGGSIIDTTTTINVTPQGGTTTSTTFPSSPPRPVTNVAASVGTTLTITGTALANGGASNSCPGFSRYSVNSQTNNGTQVWTLRNGDSVPNFPPFGGQGTIDSYLAKFLDPVTRKVKLAENQVIFLYELGTTDTSSTAYDMQDLVVLATIAPSSN
jgi:prepilin-type N-terminal cleavage/methylation domain-containing protein